MYIAAQLVRSPDRRTTGVNVTLYRHGPRAQDGIDWTRVDLMYIAEQHPGRFAFDVTEVHPGGNSVLAFLDVAAPDDLPITEVRGLVQGATVDRDTGDSVRRHAESALLFHVIPSLDTPSARRTAFEALRARVLAIVPEHREVQPARTGALYIIASRTDDIGWVLRLSPESEARVALLRPDDASTNATIRVRDEVLHDMHFYRGKAWEAIVPSVVGLDLGAIEQLGGVEVRCDGEPNSILWRSEQAARSAG